MKINKSTLNEEIYEVINLPDNAAIVNLGCRYAGYLNGIINEFSGKVTKAIGGRYYRNRITKRAQSNFS